MCVLCELLCVMCYVIKTPGTKGLVAMNDLIMILGIYPKFGLSILWSNSKIFSSRLILIYFKIKIFLSDCFNSILTQIYNNVDKCDFHDLFSRS